MELVQVHAEFARRFSAVAPAVVAGGAVRDWLMKRPAKDYDVFLLGVTPDRQGLGEQVGAALADLEAVTPLPFHKSEPYLQASVLWNGVEVQVMATPAPTLEALLDTFDWNVCRFGFDGAETVALETVDNIAPGLELRLHRITYPMSTLRRGFRFSERFGMQFRKCDILRLSALVALRPECFMAQNEARA